MNEVIEKIGELHSMLVTKNKKADDLIEFNSKAKNDYEIRLSALKDREASVSKREGKCASDEETAAAYEATVQMKADLALKEKDLKERESAWQSHITDENAALSKERDRINALSNQIKAEKEQLEKDKQNYKTQILEEIRKRI